MAAPGQRIIYKIHEAVNVLKIEIGAHGISRGFSRGQDDTYERKMG